MPTPIPIHPKASGFVQAGALRVALLYAGVSAAWILLSDRAVEGLFPDPALMTRASILKGWFFVAVTALLLFAVVNRLLIQAAHREAKLRTLIRAIPDLVWLKDPAGVYLGCNPAFERYFGAREAEILGRTDYDFVEKDLADFFRRKDREAIQAGATQENDEWITLAATGQRVLLETLKTPMYDGKGALIGVLGIGRDITEHRGLVAEQIQLQNQLHQAQKMELVGRFAGGVAHDYNNMLGVILANADLALLDAPAGGSERKHLEEIVRAARHSADLTQQLLAFARQQPVDPRVVDFNEAIGGMLDLLGRLAGPDIQILWTPVPDLWPVRVDPTQLDQVLTNLVVNARDAMGGSGCIEVATANLARPGEGPLGDQVCLSVRDDGSGMAPDLVARIFEPFFTTKPRGKGTGLGLAMVQGVVLQNQGSVQVESEPGRGTCFRILFPRAPEPTCGVSANPG